MRKSLFVCLLVLFVSARVFASSDIQTEPANPVFAKFYDGLGTAVKMAGGDIDSGSYHFIFALCTAGNNAAEVSAAKDIMFRCLKGGLIVPGDQVTEVSFELAPWHVHWTGGAYDPKKDGGTETANIKAGPIPLEAYSDLERRRDQIGMAGGHDAHAMFLDIFRRLDPELSRKTVIVVFMASNLLDEPPYVPAARADDFKKKTLPPFLLRDRSPREFRELQNKAVQCGFGWGKDGLEPTNEIPLTIPAPEGASAPANLRVFYFAANGIAPLATLSVSRKQMLAAPTSVVDQRGGLDLVASDQAGHPVAGVTVALEGPGRIGETDKTGHLSTDLEQGDYTLSCTKDGYTDYGPRKVAIKQGTHTSLAVRMALRPSTPTAWWMLIVPLLLLFRWKIQPAREDRYILMPIIWPVAYCLMFKAAGRPNTTDMVLEPIAGVQTPEGRLLKIRTFIVVLLASALRNTKQGTKVIFGSGKIDVQTTGDRAQIAIKATPTLDPRIGIMKVSPRAASPKNGSPGRRSPRRR